MKEDRALFVPLVQDWIRIGIELRREGVVGFKTRSSELVKRGRLTRWRMRGNAICSTRMTLLLKTRGNSKFDSSLTLKLCLSLKNQKADFVSGTS
jgi:hypothetical protein